MVHPLQNLQMLKRLTNSYLLSAITSFSVAVTKYQEQEQFLEESIKEGLVLPELVHYSREAWQQAAGTGA